MLSSAIIIFREVFEIVLIVGIVLAATKNIPNRMKAVYAGFAGGLLGSALVAIFTGTISDFAEGLGQEYFNAGVLFTAAGFIGWTLLWMKKHAKEMKAHFAKIGHDVAIGRVPMITLSAVIALAIVREGSEIALFSYGMLATGQSVSSLLTGAAIGLTGGATIGILLYMGLIKLSPRVFLQATSGLLMLLVAGMMSQGVGFLSAAGMFENLSRTVWDSSWLLSEKGIIGESLHALIGYTARPSAIQLMTYIATLLTLVTLMRIGNSDKPSEQRATPTAAAITLALAGLIALPQTAQAGKSVTSPYVSMGETEIESKTEYKIDNDSNINGAWEQSVSAGYGITDFWYTELGIEAEKDGISGSDPEFSYLEWENKFQLTEHGEYFIDAGVKTEIKYNLSGDADKAKIKGLFAKDVGKFSHTTNLGIERQFGEDRNNDTVASLSWSTVYRYAPDFEPGFEYYGDFGALDDGSSFSEENHRLGPVGYGKIGEIGYDVGVLFGLSKAAPDGTIKVNLEYEF